MYIHTHIYTSTWHLPIGVRGGHIFTLSNAINANCSSKAELKLFAGRGTKGLLCHIYMYIYIYVYVCSKMTKLFWSNPPSLLEQNIALEQQSITFGAKACFGAALHHLWSKNFFWSNTPSLLEQKLVWEQLFWSKSLFWSNAPSLLEQKLALEQHCITFGAKTCFGSTLHNFWSKILLRSNTPSLFVQKVVLKQHSITFGPKACFGATINCFSNKKR